MASDGADPPFPIVRELVPPVTAGTPEGFTTINEPLTAGVPHAISLDRELRVVLVVATGLARAWRDADPAAVAFSSDDEYTAVVPGGDLLARPRAALLIRSGTAVLATVPLVAGVRHRIPRAEGGVVAELIVVRWQLRAGSLRGPGDVGSRIELAWRRVDRAADSFAPQLDPRVLSRSNLGAQISPTTPLTGGRG
jgi:hypothetical protein